MTSALNKSSGGCNFFDFFFLEVVTTLSIKYYSLSAVVREAASPYNLRTLSLKTQL